MLKISQEVNTLLASGLRAISGDSRIANTRFGAMLRLLDRDQRAFWGEYLAVVGSSIDVFVYVRVLHRRGEFTTPYLDPVYGFYVICSVQCD